MSDEPWNDPKELARLRKVEDMSYAEIADELGCSTGTISIRFNEEYYPKLNEQMEQYDASDFEGEKHVEDLDELTTGEVEYRVEEYLTNNFVEPTLDIGHLYVEQLFLAVVVAETEVGEAIDKAYGLGVKNPVVAISEHIYTEPIEEKFDDEAIGLIVVSEDEIRVGSDCELTHGSGISYVFGDASPEAAYNEAAYLNWRLSTNTPMQEICQEASLLPRTVRRLEESIL